MFDVPVAIVIFNRPELTETLVDRLRVIGTRRLFVIADGPRPDRAGEAGLVFRTRKVINRIDWNCQVTRVYSDHNLGCGLRIRSGISAALREVDRLIVLEDDCRPNLSYFRFAQQLLQRFENEPTVMSISGTCFHEHVSKAASYYFSRYPHCWGWATWRRAWSRYDLSDLDWCELSRSDRFAELFDTKHEQAYWTQLLDRIAQRALDSWAIPWVLTCWLNGGLSITPTTNLVSNIGFGEGATHTNFDSPLAALPTFELGDLHHPNQIARDVEADAASDRLLYSGTWRNPGMLKSTLNLVRRRFGNCRNIDPVKRAA